MVICCLFGSCSVALYFLGFICFCFILFVLLAPVCCFFLSHSAVVVVVVSDVHSVYFLTGGSRFISTNKAVKFFKI